MDVINRSNFQKVGEHMMKFLKICWGFICSVGLFIFYLIIIPHVFVYWMWDAVFYKDKKQEKGGQMNKNNKKVIKIPCLLMYCPEADLPFVLLYQDKSINNHLVCKALSDIDILAKRYKEEYAAGNKPVAYIDMRFIFDKEQEPLLPPIECVDNDTKKDTILNKKFKSRKILEGVI